MADDLGDVMSEELQKRKKARLQEYDYSAAGWYFVTICTKGKEKLLWQNTENRMDPTVGAAICRPQIPEPVGAAICRPQIPEPVGAAICRPSVQTTAVLSKLGCIVEETIQDIPNHYLNVRVDKYVVMPNHVHIIIVLEERKDTFGRQIAAPTPTLSTVVGQLKRVASMKAGFPLWQKGYYDHIIRNEADYRRVWQYIDDNPGKWTEDEYYI